MMLLKFYPATRGSRIGNKNTSRQSLAA
jgi:hypothetical protein